MLEPEERTSHLLVFFFSPFFFLVAGSVSVTQTGLKFAFSFFVVLFCFLKQGFSVALKPVLELAQ